MQISVITLLDRYIVKQLVSFLGLVASVFALVGISSQLLRLVIRPEFASISFIQGLQLVGYAGLIASVVIFPAAFLAASMATVARMSSDGELFALEAAGIPLVRMLRPLLALGTLVGLLTLAATCYGEPWARRQIRGLVLDIEGRFSARALESGWAEELVSGLSGLRLSDSSSGVLLMDARVPEERHVIVARQSSLEFPDSEGRLRLSLEDGTIASALPAERYHRMRFDRYELNVPVTQWLSELELVDLYPGELRQRIVRLKQQGKAWGHEAITLEKKLAVPAACLIFALLVLPLGVYRGKNPQYYGGFVATGLLLLYYLAIRFIDAYAVDSPLSPGLVVWLPNGVLLALGSGLSWRQYRRG